jgi:tetratricopeptide (TPR) repeat protein
MNLAIFATSIVFCLWLLYKIRASKSAQAEQEKSFWELERKANNTRRKSLDDLDYIEIPFDSLPFHLLTEDEQVAEYHETFKHLSEKPIVNLSCISNTELKLRYGAPNITILSRYDSAYTVLARTLQSWAAKLHEAGYIKEAQDVLEFAFKTGTDVSGTYFMLADIYLDKGEPEKVEELLEAAGNLNSSLSKVIVRRLKEIHEGNH